jgi:Uma2 family endonuclease
MATQPKPFLTPQQYLEIERHAERKSEYLNGEMFLMAGGTREHGKIIDNLTRHLGNALSDKPCFAYSSEVRLWIAASAMSTILLLSTEACDRGRKFRDYLKVPSLRDYLLVEQEDVRVDHFIIQSVGNHTFRSYNKADDRIQLPSIDCSLTLREIYQKTRLAA